VSITAFDRESVNHALRHALRSNWTTPRRRPDPAVQASSRLLDGDPAGVLIGQSDQLDLLIVGSPGYGPMRSVVLGSVSRTLAREAACPVIVVPRGDRD
jgi:nucleotide-binding universal stress UspA family protein